MKDFWGATIKPGDTVVACVQSGGSRTLVAAEVIGGTEKFVLIRRHSRPFNSPAERVSSKYVVIR